MHRRAFSPQCTSYQAAENLSPKIRDFDIMQIHCITVTNQGVPAEPHLAYRSIL